jgi:putative N6-adenine-specific DNA methylase
MGVCNLSQRSFEDGLLNVLARPMMITTDVASKGFRRQVKRFVQAPGQRFAVIVPPGLSEVCRRELAELSLAGDEVQEGVLEVAGKWTTCYQLNLWLRTASRILCRLPTFRAGVIGELSHKVLSFPWELWLNPKIPLVLQCRAQQSRIHHEGLIGTAILGAIQRRFADQGLPVPTRHAPAGKRTEQRFAEVQQGSLPRPHTRSETRFTGHDESVRWKQRFLVHLHRNHCEISLDTSGPHLHQRGYRLQHAGAPLRETLAAGILLQTNWNGDRPLLDGMCGAGTVAIEAALLARHLPPGLNREFLFSQWPSFQEKTWAHFRRKAQENVLPHAPAPILGLDQDRGALGIAMHNAARAGVAESIRWHCMDFFAFNPDALGLARGVLVLDPPYGMRLAGSGNVRAFYQRLGSHLHRFYRGWQVAVAAPNAELATLLKISSAHLWRIPHGGIPLVVSLAQL